MFSRSKFVIGSIGDELCIVEIWTNQNQPEIIETYWPTGLSIARFKDVYGADLVGAEVDPISSGYFRFAPRARFIRPLDIILTGCGQSKPIDTRRFPAQPPKRAKRFEWIEGHWYVDRAKGWKRVDGIPAYTH